MTNNIMLLDIDALVQKAEDLALTLVKDKLKTNQIRNFYSGITRMRTDFTQDGDFKKVEKSLVMLKPKLAYAAGRQSAVRANFYPFMKSAIDGVLQSSNKIDALDKFFLLVESVVAYHKFHGGE
jgi:CRISPR-associated protein Csm2